MNRHTQSALGLALYGEHVWHRGTILNEVTPR